MKSQAHRVEDLQRSRVEADLETTLNALFRRCPTLCGFSVRDAAQLARVRLPLPQINALYVTEVSESPWSGPLAPAELYNEIVDALADLLDACPETYELLRERSFARAFH